MPRYPLGKNTKASRDVLAKKLEARDCDPVAELIDALQFSMPLSNDEASHPCIQKLCDGDYELLSANPYANWGKEWLLRPRLKLRVQGFGDLLSFLHPRLKASE